MSKDKKTASEDKNGRKGNHPETIEEELLREDEFRVAIFGSARIKPEDEIYQQVYDLAKTIGHEGFDIITGGGPGLMQAGNAGHVVGDKDDDADSIGLIIKLPWENEGNKHLEIKKEFAKFSDRLDHFMALSDVVVVYPGGIGTCLEFFYTWQLIQVRHICPVPIILVGRMWEKLMEWVKSYPLKNGLISAEDLDVVHIAKDNEDAMKIIQETHKRFLKEGPNACKLSDEYLKKE